MVYIWIRVSFHHLGYTCALPPGWHHHSTPLLFLQSGLRSIEPHSHRGGSHHNRAGHLLWSKEPLHSSCHLAPLRPVPTRGLDSSFHLQRQGQVKETLKQHGKGQSKFCVRVNILGNLKLTVFYVNKISSTASVVRESWKQFTTAAHWARGISPTQVTALTAMMMWLLSVQQPIAANLFKIQFHKNRISERNAVTDTYKMWDWHKDCNALWGHS